MQWMPGCSQGAGHRQAGRLAGGQAQPCSVTDQWDMFYGKCEKWEKLQEDSGEIQNL